MKVPTTGGFGFDGWFKSQSRPNHCGCFSAVGRHGKLQDEKNHREDSASMSPLEVYERWNMLRCDGTYSTTRLLKEVKVDA